MKKRTVYRLPIASLFLLTLLVSGCKKEENIMTNTTYVESPAQAPEPKNVLIEMYTGIASGNCPEGINVLTNLVAGSNGRIIGIAMHSVIEPAAIDQSIPGLTTQVLGSADAQAIVDYFGEIGVRPAASINRIMYSDYGSPSIYTDRGNWAQYAQASLNIPTPVNLYVGDIYTAANRTVTVSAEMHYTAAQTDTPKLSVFLTEDSIVTAQDDHASASRIDTFYVHNMIMRKALTSPTGDTVNVHIQAGTVIRRIYTYQISNTTWKPEHMHIVAFVHRAGTTAPEVLQVKCQKIQ